MNITLRKLEHNRDVVLVVQKLACCAFPIIAELKGRNMTRFHMIALWQGRIIDFESEHTSSLSVDNLHSSCGYNCQFEEFISVRALIPPKKIQNQYISFDGSKYNWGTRTDPTITGLQIE